MKRLQEILARMQEIQDRLGEFETLERSEEFEAHDDETRSEMDELVAEFDELKAEEAPLRAQAEKLAEIRANTVREIPAAPEFKRDVEPTELRTEELHRYGRGEVRDNAMATLERSMKDLGVTAESAEQVERMLDTRTDDFDGDKVARRMLLTETDAYRSAWMKVVTGRTGEVLPDEARALAAFRNQGLTDASGGYAVPTLVDPTIILTTGAADLPILKVARIEPITNDVWRGVSSAGTSWSFDAENATVSDDSVTLAQPTVTAHKAQGFIPFSIEISMDYPAFAREMTRLLGAGYMNLLASATMTGTGSDQPFGIFTAIDDTAAREVIVTTSGSLAPQDVLTAWNKLGEMYRDNKASWFSSVSVETEVRNSGTDNGYFTIDLTAGGLVQVNGRPWYKSDYAPAFSGTTGTVNLLVVGDFKNYVVAQRAGMSVETVQHLVDVTYNRPTGNRGFYAWARVGADSVNDTAFALLKNAT